MDVALTLITGAAAGAVLLLAWTQPAPVSVGQAEIRWATLAVADPGVLVDARCLPPDASPPGSRLNNNPAVLRVDAIDHRPGLPRERWRQLTSH